MDPNQMNQNAPAGADENATPAPTPEPPQAPTPEPQMNETPSEKGSLGPIVGILIIVLVIAFGGYYFWTTQLKDRFMTDDMSADEILNQEDEALMELQQQGSSDEIADIEADLDATDLEGLDEEFDAVEEELGQ